MIANFSRTAAFQTEHVSTDGTHRPTSKRKIRLSYCGIYIFPCFWKLVFDQLSIQTTLFMTGMKGAIGEPSAVSYYPALYSSDNTNGFIGRLKNFVGYFLGSTFDTWKYDAEIAALPKTYKGPRCWRTLLSNVAFNFVNSNPFIDYPSATLPKTVFVGGMQVNTKKQGKVKLSKEWDDVFSKRSRNVLVSFGSMAFSSFMPDEYKKTFLEVFAYMPDTTFIWKFHYSVTNPETLTCSQDTAEFVQLDKALLDQPNEIRKPIHAVLDDSNYKKNAERLAKVLEDQPNKPKNVVLKHCDFAVQFGPLETLNSEGRHLNTFAYYSLDIALAVIVVLLAVLFVMYRIVKHILFRVVKKTIFTPKKKIE
ncbi:Protein CBG24722 [Caenorhabditis briggsae]|uniref:glucuronosyltransferase n=1 Tax=Caenorhabditis briggsae TaxID=6238 RepID=A8WLB7_CAEBR|nr:Protein CBG24722 [Caenorhabditis briggsae]CAP21262.1 Protein CBG24722 [Caenorhabditis briggsae]